VVGVVNREVADVSVCPARLVGRVVVDGDTTHVTGAVAQTVRQRLVLNEVDGVEGIVHVQTCPAHTCCTRVSPHHYLI